MGTNELLQAISNMMDQKLEPIKNDLQSVKEEQIVIKKELQSVKDDLQSVKEEQIVIKKELQSVKDDL
ncbi:MAG: hypothetical protein HFI76_03500, partial [Lachnospiraceae bacterium]|nr:hypothetical protein [Lachnospiraceae bacterium]